jgi:hypothetical protein
VRVACGPGDESWSKPNGEGRELQHRAFHLPVPRSDWETIVTVAVCDAPIGGNVLARVRLESKRADRRGDVALTFDPGSLVMAP